MALFAAPFKWLGCNLACITTGSPLIWPKNQEIQAQLMHFTMLWTKKPPEQSPRRFNVFLSIGAI